MKQKYYPFLDGLRAIAILAVIFFHGRVLLKPDNVFLIFIKKLSLIGHLGVDMFFVISGFLITGILIEDWNGKIRLKRFYVRRLFRIFPQYFFFIICGFLFIIGRDVFKPSDLFHNQDLLNVVLSYFFFFQNYMLRFDSFQHTWSLAIEEHFYLLYPAIIVMIFNFQKDPNKRRHWLIITVFSIIILLLSDRILGGGKDFLSRQLNPPNFNETTFFRIDALLFGCLLRYLEPYYALNGKWVSKHFGTICFLLGTLIFVLFIVTSFMVNWVYYALTYLASGLLLLSCYKQFKPMLWMTENPVMRWIGKYSYGIYLWHWEVLNFHHMAFIDHLWISKSFVSYAICSVLMGFLTAKIIDNVFIKVRNKVAP